MTNPPIPANDIEAQAVLWLVRIGDPAFTDWSAFERWLGASPAHADAYHQAAAADAEMVDLLASAPLQTVVATRNGPRWRPAPWLGGALAAGLLLAIGYGALRPVGSKLYQTGPGQHRDIALADGTRIALNGNTRLTMAANDPHSLRLEHGEALFTGHHDPAHPFAVIVADATIADVGTVFDVVREETATRVAVAEGSVVWNPLGEAIALDAGKRLSAQDGSPTLQVTSADPQAVGGWSRGELVYDGAPLVTVAGDLARSLGVTVTVSPAAASLPVRGIIRLNGGADAVMPRFAALLGVSAKRADAGWRLSATP